MTQLATMALDDFARAGVDPSDIAELRWGVREWHGDACGCTDDRCIGFHHNGSECGCRPVVIRDHLEELAAAKSGADLWRRYVDASVKRDDIALRDVADDLARWTARYHPWALSWSFDEVVDGRQGITITSRFNDLHHLVWVAPASV